jgi:ribosomal protein S18 acetylase RimI-like enzyme
MQILKATKSDKKSVVEILCEAFKNDPHIKYIVGQGKGFEKRYKQLMSYAFEQAQVNGFIGISDDKTAVSIWRKYNSKKMTVSLLLESLLFFYHFGISGMKRIIEMEKSVQKEYPKDKLFLYLWFIGTLPKSQGLGYGTSLLNPILEKCLQDNVEVYLETSTKRNVLYYQRKGFVVYNTLSLGQNCEIELSLMKKSIGS